ncbi:MAG: HNH endonuclease signature motif containing protein [Ornithinibacter sp.]
MALGPNEVEAAADAAVAALSAVLAPSDVSGSRQEWAAAAGSLQQVIDVATAAQDAAIVRLAAIEPDWLDDGTEVETHRALGHLALDAPSILSGVLSTTAVHAERRVRAAVHLAADGPVGSDTHTGLGGLHLAMAAGRLDAYRAGVVADELEHAPAEVRASVVAALEQHFEREDGTHLRRRCRRVLARISPDLLLQRAARARAESGLRRWVDEPGVDKWEGTFPSEEAAQAWAAIDALARQYVTDGHCATIERGRAKALTDLVAGNATITTVLTVAVPAEALPTPAGADIAGPVAVSPAPAAAPFRRANDGPERVEGRVARTGAGDLVEVTGPAAGQPVLVSGQWLAETAQTATTEVAPCHPITGALISDDLTIGPGGAALVPDSPPGSRAGAGGDAYRPSARIAKRIRARDRRCRFPGCTVAAVFCDLDHVRPWPAGRTTDDNLLCLCRRHHRIKQRPGWTMALTLDGVASFTDPTGRVRTTHPVDALHTTILATPLTAASVPASPVSTSRARTVIPDGPHTELEFRLEHLATPGTGLTTTRGQPHRYPPVGSWRDDTGTRHVPELTPRPEVLLLTHTTTPCRRVRENGRHAFPEEPPF